jgi:hypothetical protein
MRMTSREAQLAERSKDSAHDSGATHGHPLQDLTPGVDAERVVELADGSQSRRGSQPGSGSIVSEERQIAALREEIRRRGKASFLFRWGLPLCVTLAVASLLLILSAVGGLRFHEVPLVALLVTWIVLLGWLRNYSRFRYLRRLREVFGAMPPAARGDLLRSLREDRIGDIRAIAQSLSREFGAPAEVAPTTVRNARGDEAAPAEASP